MVVLLIIVAHIYRTVSIFQVLYSTVDIKHAHTATI